FLFGCMRKGRFRGAPTSPSRSARHLSAISPYGSPPPERRKTDSGHTFVVVWGTMKSGDFRTCDICDEMNYRGSSFVSGRTTPAFLNCGDPATWPSFDIEVDGTALLDLCRRCVDRSELLLASTIENIDMLH